MAGKNDAISCGLRDIGNVLSEDTLRSLEKDSKWSLVLDGNGNVSTFLKYRHVNYLLAYDSKDMEKETLRKAILGAIRFGKTLVIDMGDTDLHDHVAEKINTVRENLMEDIMKKTIVSEEKYVSLIQESDGKEYELINFSPEFTDKFSFVVLVKGSQDKVLPQVLKEKYRLIHVK